MKPCCRAEDPSSIPEHSGHTVQGWGVEMAALSSCGRSASPVRNPGSTTVLAGCGGILKNLSTQDQI